MKSGSCLYHKDPTNLDKIDICDPEKLDCYLANPYLTFWISAYLYGFDMSACGLDPIPPFSDFSVQAIFYYFLQKPEELNSYIIFYNKMQYESQNMPFINFEIGWYCRYTADNENNYFYSLQIIPDNINLIFPNKKSFCGSMCCFRKAYNLRGWFWQTMQFVLRFFSEQAKLIKNGKYTCQVTLPEITLEICAANGVTYDITLPSITIPSPTIMFTTFDGQTFLKNCSCVKCCVYDNTNIPEAPWYLNGDPLSELVFHSSIAPVIDCPDTCSPCPGCSADCTYP